MNDPKAKPESELEVITGYLKTSWDCGCGYVNYAEGDAQGDEVECDDCHEKYQIGNVM